jgi:hypothetical protein
LEQAQTEMTGTALVLTFDKTFNHDMANRSIETIREQLHKKFGSGIFVELRLVKPTAAPVSAAQPAAPATNSLSVSRDMIERESSESFDTVAPDKLSPEAQKALKHFPGPVKRERRTASSAARCARPFWVQRPEVCE